MIIENIYGDRQPVSNGVEEEGTEMYCEIWKIVVSNS